MNLKSIIIGAAFAIVAPFAASASTVVDICDASGTQTVFPTIPTSPAEVYNCDFSLTGAATVSGTYAYLFEANPTPVGAFATNVQLASASGDLTGVSGTVSWYQSDAGGAKGALLGSQVMAVVDTPITSFFGANLPTTFLNAAPDYQLFEVDWSGFSGPVLDVNVTVEQVVPLPAGILLMGTALAGFGVMRRRKKAA